MPKESRERRKEQTSRLRGHRRLNRKLLLIFTTSTSTKWAFYKKSKLWWHKTIAKSTLKRRNGRRGRPRLRKNRGFKNNNGNTTSQKARLYNSSRQLYRHRRLQVKFRQKLFVGKKILVRLITILNLKLGNRGMQMWIWSKWIKRRHWRIFKLSDQSTWLRLLTC